MRRTEAGSPGWIAGSLVAGSTLLGGLLLTLAAWPRSAPRTSGLSATEGTQAFTYTEADVEAAARMLASEKASGSRALHIEMVHTQLRARKPGQSLYDRITAGSGWGPQGERSGTGGVRPVSTEQLATPALRQLARDLLEGQHPSMLPGARKFFEPAQQDRALALAKRARTKQAAGQSLTAKEKRLLGYRHSAEEVRTKWLAAGAHYVGTLDETEFFT